MLYDVDTPLTKAGDLIDCFFGEGVFQPTHLFDVSERGTCGYLFRGQADKALPLVPSAHRTDDALIGFTPQPPDRRVLDRGHIRRYLGMHLHAELRAVFLFLEEADRLGIRTPLDYGTMRLLGRS